MNCERWYLERRLMIALWTMSVVIVAGIMVLLYCLVGFSRELRSARIHPPNATKLSDGEPVFLYKPGLSNSGIAVPEVSTQGQRIPSLRRTIMWDAVMVLSSLAFFAIAIACTCACERLR